MSTEPEQGWRWWLEHLAFPVVLASVTALAAIVAKEIQGKHDRQAELAVKTDLVSRMSSSSTDAVFNAQDVANRTAARSSADPRTAHQAAFDEGLREWSVADAEIQASLVTYFGSTASMCWNNYGDAVANYIRLSADPGEQRTSALNALRELRVRDTEGSFDCPLGRLDDPSLDWDVLAEGLPTRPGHPYAELPAKQRKAFRTAYAELGQDLLSEGAELSAVVAHERASGF
jgi:hypothetical protein